MLQEIPISKDNYLVERNGYKIEGVVIHVMQGTIAGTDAWFGGQNIASGVYSSSHEGIAKNGDVHLYVKPEDSAYHAGRVAQPVWSGIKKNMFGAIINPNYYTYGIECEGFRGETWTSEQMVSLLARVKKVLDDNQLPYTRVRIISHNEVTIDKEDMRTWCDEIVRRLNLPNPPVIDIKTQIKQKVAELDELVKQL